MFLLRYKICDEDLATMTLDDFDEYGNIEGQIELSFNNETFGYYDDDTPFFGDELLVTWFKLLNQAKNKIKNGEQYVAVMDIESDMWIEFLNDEKTMKVNLIKTEIKDFDYLVATNPIGQKKYIWSNVILEKDQFIKELEYKTKKFIDDIISLNPSLKESKVLKELKNII